MMEDDAMNRRWLMAYATNLMRSGRLPSGHPHRASLGEALSIAHNNFDLATPVLNPPPPNPPLSAPLSSGERNDASSASAAQPRVVQSESDPQAADPSSRPPPTPTAAPTAAHTNCSHRCRFCRGLARPHPLPANWGRSCDPSVVPLNN